MALISLRPAALAALALSLPFPAIAADSAPAPAAEADVPAAPQVVPPTPLAPPTVAYPPNAPAGHAPVQVTVQIVIDTQGAVREVTLVQGAGEPFDSAVLEGAKAFRFTPALVGGKPAEVALPFTQTFVAPPPPAAQEAGAEGEQEDPSLTAVLEGTVQVRGTRDGAANVSVVARSGERERYAQTDEQGRFRLALPAGDVEVRIVGTGYRKFLQRERLKEGERLRLRYLVDKESYDPFEAVIVGSRERTEVSRTTLSGREITKVPGTFGDPYRVMMVLPGVTSAMSLLPLPIVRGSSPGSTGIFLDNTRLPMLFHLFGGPSVVHPEFVDRIDFYPGGFPVSYGGYTGGIVDGITRRPKAGEDKLDLDLNLAQTGVFLRKTIEPLGITATAAGRIGYPGLLMSLAVPFIDLSYWDYQARVDGGRDRLQWTVFAFGAKDHLQAREDEKKPFETIFRTEFHRLDLRLRHGTDERHGLYRLVFGRDTTFIGPQTPDGVSYVAHPQARWTTPLTETVKLNAGADWQLRWNAQQEAPVGDEGPALPQAPGGVLHVAGAFVEAPWKVRDDLLLVPGVRADLYTLQDETQWNVDPRLSARWKVSEGEQGATTLKAQVGWYHQPPRLFLPLPGYDQSTLSLGLLASLQSSIGAEVQLAPGIELDVNGYYNHMNPVVFDLAVNPGDVNTGGPTTPPGQPPPQPDGSGNGGIDNFFAKRKGRSFGLEVLLRKRDSQNLFGWVSYTLSRSERLDEEGWAPFDFDRLHVLNLVGGIKLPRNWEIGGRLLLQTGTPVTTIAGHNAARTDGQMRFDLRIDKRAVWNDWMLDFYVDVVNATVATESGGLVGGQAFRYLVPTVGFRAVL